MRLTVEATGTVAVEQRRPTALETMAGPTVDRKFWPILIFSIALHAFVLAWVKGMPSDVPQALPAIMVQLRMVVAEPVSTSEPPTAAPVTSAPAEVPPQARQLPPRREHRSVRDVAEAAEPLAIAPKISTPATPAAIAVATPAEAAPKVLDAPAPQSRPQGPLLDAYRQRLSELLASQQQYPRVAAMRGWEGEVRLRLRVARKGNLVAVQLDHSSGFDVLDQHALAMLERLAGLPPLPDGLESNEIQVVVPINYKLNKPT